MTTPTAKRLGRGRRAARLTTIALGRMIGCSPSSISHMEAGKRTPGLALAARLEAASRSWPGGPILAVDWTRESAEDRAA